MSALVIGGVPVPVARGGATQKESFRVGSTSRSYAGSLRSTVRAEKRVWQFTTPPIPQATDASLRAAVALGALVTCSGDLIGSSITCDVLITDGPYVPVGASFRRALSLTVSEV